MHREDGQTTMAEPLLQEKPVPDRGAERADPPGEARLLRMKQGDRSAFEDFYREHSGSVYGLCVRLARDRDQAEEMTQEVFVRAWQHRKKLSSAAHARNWLHRVAINLWRTRLRLLSRRGEPLELDEERAPAPRPLGATGGLRTDLERAVATLPDRPREVLVLHDVLGYRHAEIGEMLEIATNTSKVQLHRARKRLREVLTS